MFRIIQIDGAVPKNRCFVFTNRVKMYLLAFSRVFVVNFNY